MSSPSSPHYRGSKRPDKVEKFIEGQFKPEDGQGQMIIYPQALDIIWGGDDRYWKINKNNRDDAELVQVCWLEVTGSCDLKNVKLDTEYKLEFEVELKPDAFGWNNPVYVMAKVGDTRKWKKFDLSRSDSKPATRPAVVFKSGSVKDPKLTFGLYDIWTGRWKGGLLIKKVTISPDKPAGQTSSN